MPRPSSRQQLTILEAMVLIAGVAFGLWLFQENIGRGQPLSGDFWLVCGVAVFGGLSLAGTPIILFDRFRKQRRWRSGAFLWLGMGLACWGIAPAIAMIRLKLGSDRSMAVSCFAYSLPLMGLFLLFACVIGGRPVPRWWTCRGWWPEWFGMWMLVGWSLTGLYVLFLIYRGLF